MIGFIRRLFKKGNTYPGPARGIYDFLTEYTEAKHHERSMFSYIRENQNCEDFNLMPSKNIIRRYSLTPWKCGLAWYLLEQYFKGNITIKDKKIIKGESDAEKSAWNAALDAVKAIMKAENFMSLPPRPTGLVVIHMDDFEKLRK